MPNQEPRTRAEFDRELVEALCEIDDGLTEWEVEFVDSLARHLAISRHMVRSWTLTYMQRVKALQIAEKHGLSFGEVPRG